MRRIKCLNKEKFKSILSELEILTDKTHKIYELGITIDTYDCLEPIIVDLLKLHFSDKEEWIEYFMYELDYGKRYKPNMIIDENGNDISMCNSDELYDLLISNMNMNNKGE